MAQYGAGVRLGPEIANAAAHVFTDPAAWERMAAGARRLCLAEFDLDRNVAALSAALSTTAYG